MNKKGINVKEKKTKLISNEQKRGRRRGRERIEIDGMMEKNY